MNRAALVEEITLSGLLSVSKCWFIFNSLCGSQRKRTAFCVMLPNPILKSLTICPLDLAGVASCAEGWT